MAVIAEVDRLPRKMSAAGAAPPTSGHATVAGCDVVSERDRYKPLINLVTQEQFDQTRRALES